MAEEMAMLIDTTKCTACRACQVACKQWNQNSFDKTVNTGSYENPPTLSSKTWTRVTFNEHYRDNQMQWLFAKYQCMHCTDAACVEVCPSGATRHEEVKVSGGVVKRVATDAKKCIGCNYCRVACPYDVPGYNEKKKGIYRCTLCVDRTGGGKAGFEIPACVKTCAPGALEYGPRKEMMLKAKARVAKLKKDGASEARTYGETELNGLGYLYVLSSKPEDYGLPADPSVPASVEVWKMLAKPYGGLAALGLIAALVVNKVISARNRGLEEKYKLES